MDAIQVMNTADDRIIFCLNMARYMNQAGFPAKAAWQERRAEKYRRLSDRATDRAFERTRELAQAAGMIGGCR